MPECLGLLVCFCLPTVRLGIPLFVSTTHGLLARRKEKGPNIGLLLFAVQTRHINRLRKFSALSKDMFGHLC